MIDSRERGLFQLLVTFQVLGAMVLFTISSWVLLALAYGQNVPIHDYAKYGLVVVVALVFEAVSRPGYLRPGPGKMRRNAGAVSRRQLLWSVGAMVSLALFSRDDTISRGFFAVFGVVLFGFLYLTNYRMLNFLAEVGSKRLKNWKLRAMILGPREWCDSVGKEIGSLSSLLDIRGIHAMEDHESDPDACVRLAAETDVDLVVMPPRHMPYDLVARMMRQGDKLGYRCWMPLEITRRYGRRFDLQRIGSLDVLTPPTEPLQNTLNQFLKRLFDIAVSLPVVVFVLPPLCAMVKLIHWKWSRGPLFFMQERVGINGTKFRVIKFRTLHVANDQESRQVSKGDSRVFPGGNLLRKLSIDEIPQFLNVLFGDMSVVGPRPHMEAHDYEFREIFERYGVRRYVKPGVTGLAQAKGFRGEVNRPLDLRHRARLDAFYVAHWDLAMDVAIVFWTFVSVIRPPKTAY
ncbi:lipopolysaccharide/colanic/teichoic acid biosynthesis glycosyltransferase [Haloferula luteola]|uniref:Lipopolysaccharide/colanic/teichoic acid biosynthesis glycosyltransferase n=1 Tax=Haloferula luteola TaxID=595692 RepID=A0A840VAL5_9BACT|nr:sugar transferase [Haloferula luteola]MBB5350839.1 lipopolysaccharide/colanic/teichoic acid biosynthesis glycosyltransferase [Haloferula luteola]